MANFSKVSVAPDARTELHDKLAAHFSGSQASVFCVRRYCDQLYLHSGEGKFPYLCFLKNHRLEHSRLIPVFAGKLHVRPPHLA